MDETRLALGRQETRIKASPSVGEGVVSPRRLAACSQRRNKDQLERVFRVFGMFSSCLHRAFCYWSIGRVNDKPPYLIFG